MTGARGAEGGVLLVSQEWPVLPGNPKTEVLLRRLQKARRGAPRLAREIEMVIAVIVRLAGRSARVLEVACGTGFAMLELAHRGFRTTGVDADRHLCALTNHAAGYFGLDAVAVAADACALPFADRSHDAVFSRSFFEHVYDVDLALREQARILRRGGILIILDGNLLNPMTLLDLLVFYPIRTRGQYGGLKWILTKRRVKRQLYGYLSQGRDEDVKTMWWWRRMLRRYRDLRIVEVGTSARDVHPAWPGFLHPFLGYCKVVAQKI